MTFLLGLFRLRSISLTANRLSFELSNGSSLLLNAQSFLKKEEKWVNAQSFLKKDEKWVNAQSFLKNKRKNGSKVNSSGLT